MVRVVPVVPGRARRWCGSGAAPGEVPDAVDRWSGVGQGEGRHIDGGEQMTQGQHGQQGSGSDSQVTPVQTRTEIRTTVESPGYSRSVYDVHQEFAQLDPAAISGACVGWKRAADELLALADDLKDRFAAPLDAAWSSPSSPKVQRQLQLAEATARALASDCLQMARATDYAAEYARWYKANLPSYTDALATAAKGTVSDALSGGVIGLVAGPTGAVAGGIAGAVTGDGVTGGARSAVQHLENLLGRYNEVIQTVPSAVQSQLAHVDLGREGLYLEDPPSPGSRGSTQAPTIGGHGGGSLMSGSGQGSGGPVGSGPVVGSGSGGGGGFGHGVSGSGLVGDPYAAGTSLAGSGLGGGVSGFDPYASGGLASGGGGGLGAGLGAGVVGATGLGAGGLASGLGAGRAGSGFGGAGGFAGAGGPWGTGGVGGSGAGVAGEGAGAGRSGVMPMQGAGGAGGRGESEEERERSTWLTEDEDVWGIGVEVVPPVITE